MSLRRRLAVLALLAALPALLLALWRADPRASLAANLSPLLLVALLGMATALLAGDRFVRRPVAALLVATRRLTSGEATARSGLRGPDELGRLGEAFDVMADALARRQARLQNLHEIDRGILHAESPGQIATAALGRVRNLAGADRASLALDDADGSRVMFAADGTGVSPFPLGRRFVLEEMLGFDAADGIPPDVLLRNEPLDVGDLTALRALPSSIRASVEAGSRSILSVPLGVDGVLLGRLSALSTRVRAFGPEEAQVMVEVGAQLAVALHDARLRQEQARHSADLEQRVEERTKRLAEINAELDAFSYTVSHDLRAPLRAVSGFADALLEDFGAALPAAGQDYARRVVGAARRMDALIQDLLSYSRVAREELPLHRVELGAVVEEALQRHEAEVRSQTAQVTVVAPLPSVVGHRSTLVHVVANLVGNGLKFVAAGQVPELRVRAEATDGRVRLWVEDKGIGFAPEYASRIFGVFERLHPSDKYAGTGIGLAIVRRAVERMAGHVGVESAPGQGARFWIELPAAADPPEVQGRSA